MKRTDKEVLVNQLHDELGKSQAVFVTDYMGLNVEKLTQLRKSIKDAGGKYRVVKNTLLNRAAHDTPVAKLDASFAGPTAIAIALNDPVSIAKVLVNFAKDNEQLEIQAGVLGSQLLDENGIQALAKMPGKEVLLAKMLGSLNAPVSNFVGVFAALLRQLVYVLKAVEEQKRQGE
ncbi:MAG: 50S ribosomal protein L10 [Deltaproteobacteria bacterium ADurb.BinA179]|nr:50S ribosomal protein L10 [Deltaproteobacteria bacterium]OPZ26128.1 MAG: 50S ribosomal protein L10 [Deltaproteobacteria bacterium ADurb.BinA179]HNU74582.1 50S ribosomal protein L10 [Deltaproteobacteria bacterium]HOD72549.1 50S ribosomal protein L10 [Deltaproteobacteria bacterium]HOE74007.1 50S ribosomal protein L10 [Deltaproteobacteria bacterium]